MKMRHLQLRAGLKTNAVGLESKDSARSPHRSELEQSLEALASSEVHRRAQRALPEAANVECAGLQTREIELLQYASVSDHLPQ